MKALLEKRIFAVFILVIAALVAGIAGYSTLRDARMPVSSGTALVGGPFTLTSHEGKRVTNEDFRGKYMLVTFGYTYCPDVCPTELQIISAALELLGEQAKDIQPIFITVDPERDTPAVMKSYVSAFSPRLIGLTGTDAEVAKVAKAYAVYYKKQEAQGASGYLMDHSSAPMLFGPDGAPIALAPADEGPDAVARMLDQWVK